MFDKLLIANRGEIACRVTKTARRLGIRTVAVYSEADARARHVALADEAVLIGPAPARESYLAVDKVLAAARRSGAQAIHPGYGFLSENAEFCEACAAEGLVFVGPSAAAIRAMGSKSAAKRMMEQAGVPLLPGYHGERQEPEFLQAQAAAIGYPLLIKATAGGGGKGMRVVERPADFAAALAACRREAEASFGNSRVLLEQYLVGPRHIEFQVFGDQFGNIVQLFERDCSVQRRHQKVLEEAPAPGMSAERRAAMGQAAVAAARTVDYVGAGTVEFIVDQAGAFYFMEMNTRLQVEHPVTEMITGQDLVEWQLRVAAGEPLPLAQEAITLSGHALEARIYAEDSERDFLPSTGTLSFFEPPEEGPDLRVERGVAEGDEIGPHYDPLIAKLVVRGEDRDRARERMRRALADFRLAGVANNVDFLARLVACPAFARAELDTGLIAREQEALLPAPAEPPREAWLALALAEVLREADAAARRAAAHPEPASPWHRVEGWRLNAEAVRSMSFRHRETTKTVLVTAHGGAWAISLDGVSGSARGRIGPRGALHAEFDGHLLPSTVVAAGARRHVFVESRAWSFLRVDPLHREETAGGQGGAERQLRAPMPGRVVAVLAAAGAQVERGAPLLILEAMKMEHTLAAPAAGTVRAVRHAAGDQVEEGAELVDFAPDGLRSDGDGAPPP